MIACPSAGSFDLITFEAAGMTIDYLIEGTWDGDEERLAHDIGAIVEAQPRCSNQPRADFLPIATFSCLTADRGCGGTEYYNSTVVHTDPHAFWDEDRWKRFLGLMAREFFILGT